MLYGPPCVERGATPRFGVGEDETSCDVGCNGRPFIRLVNQMAEADVKSLESILDAHPATTGVAKGASSELPACRLRRVTQYVEENLHRELRLAELSALVHMSPYHFARLFKRSAGVPPHRFLVRRRIDAARALLAAQTAPIAEIAQLVGFRTPSHFTTTFRRVTGMTPSAYRSEAGAARVGSTSVAATVDAFDVIRGAVLGGARGQTIGCRVDG